MGDKYSIGVDFGTQSARATLLNVKNGEEISWATKMYPHGVMDEFLPDGTVLQPDWALQHPSDYFEVMEILILTVLRQGKVDKEDVIGLGVDFTSCTMLPVDKEDCPLCLKDEYKGEPHAWPKLWKHHAAQGEANILNSVAKERGEEFLARYGGKISSEWFVPKIMQILRESPEIFEESDCFMEAGDWVVSRLTGERKGTRCMAGYKSMWNKKEGYPSKGFFKALDPRMENIVDEKFPRELLQPGEKAGCLTAEMAERLGLCEGTAVAAANIDAHVSVPAVGIAETGKMLMIVGTSTCHMLLGDEEKIVPGMCGVVEDGILPGFYGYEAGQACSGDHFDWFVKNCVPKEYYKTAELEGMTIHQYLTEKASRLEPGESGLLALDWWNGNRSCLVDVDLSGMILGLTLQTRPEEIYRALIEATAYGTEKIIKTFEESGVPVNELYACGGISKKNPLMMQIYADVTGREIHICSSEQTSAVGAALFGAVAAGKEIGGYDSVLEAARIMKNTEEYSYKPNANNAQIYQKLFYEFEKLHDYFGLGGNDVMKRLKAIRGEVKG